MLAVAPLDPGPVWLSFKCVPEEFVDLTEWPGIRPAAYLARAHWISLEKDQTISRSETAIRVRKSYELVVSKLSKKMQLKIREAKTRTPRGKTKNVNESSIIPRFKRNKLREKDR